MFEDDEPSSSHKAASSRAVVLKHILEGFPKQVQIFLAETSLVGQVCGNKPMRNINAIWDRVLSPHCPIVSTLLSASAWVATAMRVMECSEVTIGSIERPNVI